MDRLQVSIACLLLKMTVDLITAQPLLKCQICQHGFFVKKNCSTSTSSPRKFYGVQCQLCTNCTATDRDTLVKCSTFANSLCGNKTTPPALTSTPMPTEAPVSAPDVWIILTVIGLSLFLVLMFSLLLTLLSCRNRQRKLKGLDPL